jgi:hypothetical protein
MDVISTSWITDNENRSNKSLKIISRTVPSLTYGMINILFLSIFYVDSWALNWCVSVINSRFKWLICMKLERCLLVKNWTKLSRQFPLWFRYMLYSVHTVQCTFLCSNGGFIKGILRGVRCTKSLRVLFLHRRPPSWTTLVLYSRVVLIFNEPALSKRHLLRPRHAPYAKESIIETRLSRRLMIWFLPLPLSRQQVVSFSPSFYVSPV